MRVYFSQTLSFCMTRVGMQHIISNSSLRPIYFVVSMWLTLDCATYILLLLLLVLFVQEFLYLNI